MTTLTLYIEDPQEEAAIRQYLAQHHPQVATGEEADDQPVPRWEDLHPELRARLEEGLTQLDRGAGTSLEVFLQQEKDAEAKAEH